MPAEASVQLLPDEALFRLSGLDMETVARCLCGRSPYGGYMSPMDVDDELFCVAEQLEAELLAALGSL